MHALYTMLSRAELYLSDEREFYFICSHQKRLLPSSQSVCWSQTASLHTADGIIPASLRTEFSKVFGTADIPRMFISQLPISLPLEAQDYDFC